MDKLVDENYIKDLDSAVQEILNKNELRKWTGYVNKVVGLLLEAKLPGAMVGELCHVVTDHGDVKPAEVVGFRGDISLLLLLVDGKGVHQGSKIVQTGRPVLICGPGLRLPLYRLLEQFDPHIHVLSYAELSPDFNVQVLETIGDEVNQTGAAAPAA